VICHVQMTCGCACLAATATTCNCLNGVFPGIDSAGGFAALLKTNARTLVKLPDGVEPADVAAHAGVGGRLSERPLDGRG
jgi:NAD+-dependent secondary alcohol dehydrogenase Adh1